MQLRPKFRKISQNIIREITEQITRLATDMVTVNPYYNFEERLVQIQQEAYEEGYKKGRSEVMNAISDFDSSKDPISS